MKSDERNQRRTKKTKRLSHVHEQKTNVVKIADLPNLIKRFNAIPIKTQQVTLWVLTN